jgi:hypothetical protein
MDQAKFTKSVFTFSGFQPGGQPANCLSEKTEKVWRKAFSGPWAHRWGISAGTQRQTPR